ncbi:prolyl-tRNA synthetase associated domain-containing protein [candidate division KSB3 bacterium]|uniref:Prolyl-tRNA synthetase associated domain-containing protein n=1 Tax=candidate division KSB3 bacterium TaxID=2044937 RepID=A0A9D5JUA9_9BACT|nr:prolyl-tRNA synthetase associated domain-containing protein [candidate division KSB3 bacterium]MBD3324378.1 prolyl-tRNA synthetase associated domain-containing protein [candidate division KSB3 bacterium]
MDIYQFLAAHDIPYERYDHLPVFTCEESNRLTVDIPAHAARTKNLFLRDRKGRRHFLVTVGDQKRVDIPALGALLGVKKLSFASPQRLERYLRLTPGAVTLLGLIHDTAHAVEVLIDEEIWQAAAVRCHPLVNTSTLILGREDLHHFFAITGHKVQVVPVPSKV